MITQYASVVVIGGGMTREEDAGGSCRAVGNEAVASEDAARDGDPVRRAQLAGATADLKWCVYLAAVPRAARRPSDRRA